MTKLDQILDKVHEIDKRLTRVETRLLGLLEVKVAVIAGIVGFLSNLISKFFA
jgi:hypothetical protein